MDKMLELSVLLETGGIAQWRGILSIFFIVLALLLIIFVLFRQTDSGGLSSAFGGGGGDGAFGAKGHKVLDRVISWMCGLFIVLALLIAYVSKSGDYLSSPSKNTPSENSQE